VPVFTPVGATDPLGVWTRSLAAQELRRITIEGRNVTSPEILFKGVGRVRDIENSPDGYLCVVLNQPIASYASSLPPTERAANEV
jgi:glucose/arabinose dehydrogenase